MNSWNWLRTRMWDLCVRHLETHISYWECRALFDHQIMSIPSIPTTIGCTTVGYKRNTWWGQLSSRVCQESSAGVHWRPQQLGRKMQRHWLRVSPYQAASYASLCRFSYLTTLFMLFLFLFAWSNLPVSSNVAFVVAKSVGRSCLTN